MFEQAWNWDLVSKLHKHSTQQNKENTMDDLIAGLTEKVGIDKETAEKVVEFLKENASEIPALLAKAGLKDKLPGGLGDLL